MTESVDSGPDALAGLLSDVWQAALGKPPSSRDADFFAAGGDSLLMVRSVTQLRKAGYAAGPADFLHGRTFGGILARLHADNSTASRAPQAPSAGPVPLLPCQSRWISNAFTDPDHFGFVWVFDVPETTPGGDKVDAERIEAAVRRLSDRHEALRTRYLLDGPDGPAAEVLARAPDGQFTTVDTDDSRLAEAFEEAVRGHRLAEGRVFNALWLPRQRYLQIAVHHLTLDGYSLTMLADELEDALTGRDPGRPAAQPRDLAADLAGWLASPRAEEDAARWAALGLPDVPAVPTDSGGPGTLATSTAVTAGLDERHTAALQTAAGRLGHPVGLLVLAAVARSVAERFGLPAVSVDTYHHGRDGVPGGHDITSALGYLQSTYPVVIHSGPRASWRTDALADLAAVPRHTFGFDALRHAGDRLPAGGTQGSDALRGSGIRLNFRSRINQVNDRVGRWLRPADTAGGSRRSARQSEPWVLNVEGDVVADRLVLTIRYSTDHYTEETVRQLLDGATALLPELAGGDPVPADGGTPR
ncbi:condensation domain-containing protein [Streptomyces sp. NPDC013455]|uniref:condensation domain-containing protein n=1 Tax=Streptomyces sp. NPDC013455 TaxID=3155605 RepID=UPI0033F523D2